MATATSKPRLRSIETIVVPDPREGRLLVLRDTQGVAEGHASMPVALAAVVGRFTGRQTCREIARDVSRELGQDVPEEVVVRLATQLEDALFCEGPRFTEALARAHQDFADLDVRPATHAGGAYYDGKDQLTRYLDTECLAAARKAKPEKPGAHGNGHHGNGHGHHPTKKTKGHIVGLVAPHIDPWRGALGYGHAYGALGGALSDEADTFVLFGTSHAPMRQPFALCRKAFATPLGAMRVDEVAIDGLARHASFDPYADQFNHKKEHSLEFQVVFLKHLLGDRPARIVPILAGLGRHQAHGTDPGRDDDVVRFLDGVRGLVASRPGRVVVIAGADLAHTGPRFGDPKGYDVDERRDLEERDRASLRHATEVRASAFWGDVVADLETRRVCGLAPIYSLLRTLPDDTKGRALHYEQNVDPDDGSIVSHAAVGFFA
jgi:MEMO1 family protein